MLFMETWLTALTPDSNAASDGFQMMREKEHCSVLVIIDGVALGTSRLKNNPAVRTMSC